MNSIKEAQKESNRAILRLIERINELEEEVSSHRIERLENTCKYLLGHMEEFIEDIDSNNSKIIIEGYINTLRKVLV